MRKFVVSGALAHPEVNLNQLETKKSISFIQFNGKYKEIEDEEFAFEHCRGARFIYKGIFETILNNRLIHIPRWRRAYQTFKRAPFS